MATVNPRSGKSQMVEVVKTADSQVWHLVNGTKNATICQIQRVRSRINAVKLISEIPPDMCAVCRDRSYNKLLYIMRRIK